MHKIAITLAVFTIIANLPAAFGRDQTTTGHSDSTSQGNRSREFVKKSTYLELSRREDYFADKIARASEAIRFFNIVKGKENQSLALSRLYSANQDLGSLQEVIDGTTVNIYAFFDRSKLIEKTGMKMTEFKRLDKDKLKQIQTLLRESMSQDESALLSHLIRLKTLKSLATSTDEEIITLIQESRSSE